MNKIEVIAVGMFAANCYLLWHDEHVLIVDPGSKSPRIQEMIDSQNGHVDGIYLTHGHFDHIAGVDVLVKKYHCPVYMNELDRPLLKDPNLNFSADTMNPITIQSTVNGLTPGYHTIGSFKFLLIDAPGHSEGSSLMIWEHHMLCGDVIFAGSIGRTDLLSGSNTKMYQTLEMVKQLDPSYDIYPGHGETTTLLRELQTNPYLN
ncbi:MAG: MBL fold metallo-hydrolase [Erysipelotrichaceae bacterium]